MRFTGLTAVLFAALAAPAFAAPQTVSVGNTFFSPDSVTVNPGDTVTWSFTQSGNHSITSDPGQPESFESDPNNPAPNHPAGFSFPHQFNALGTTGYFCRVHPSSMRARVVVVAPGTNVSPSLSNVRADPTTFCNDRSEDCDKRGTTIRFSLSEDAAVRIKVREKGEDKTLKSFKVAGKEPPRPLASASSGNH